MIAVLIINIWFSLIKVGRKDEERKREGGKKELTALVSNPTPPQPTNPFPSPTQLQPPPSLDPSESSLVSLIPPLHLIPSTPTPPLSPTLNLSTNFQSTTCFANPISTNSSYFSLAHFQSFLA